MHNTHYSYYKVVLYPFDILDNSSELFFENFLISPKTRPKIRPKILNLVIFFLKAKLLQEVTNQLQILPNFVEFPLLR